MTPRSLLGGGCTADIKVSSCNSKGVKPFVQPSQILDLRPQVSVRYYQAYALQNQKE